MTKPVLIFGHRNPDTDSICSAIAYAYLKQVIDQGRHYIPTRLGELNAETRYVLNAFSVSEPILLGDVRTQVCDVDIKRVPLTSPDISLQAAFEKLKQYETHTLPLSDDGIKLCGLITVGGIADAYMALHDSSVLQMADTPIENILHVLKGEMLHQTSGSTIFKGRVLVGAMDAEAMSERIKPGDLIIMGNREKSQMVAIEQEASMLILTGNTLISDKVRQLAIDKGCAIMRSPLDTFAVARSIYNALPLRYFMKSLPLTYFEMDDYLEDVHVIMTQKRYRNFPVLDDQQNYVGMISRIQLLKPNRKEVILVDHNELSQTVDGINDADILEIIDHHRIGGFQTPSPVYFRNQPMGCTATIIAQLYKEQGIAIPKPLAGILCAAILSDTLIFRSPTCTEVDREIAKELAGTIDLDWEAFGRAMFKAGSDLLRRTAEEIFYQDFKVFKAKTLKIGVGQISSMEETILQSVEERIRPEMIQLDNSQDFDLILFMLTDISKERTTLLFSGQQSHILESAFPNSRSNNTLLLEGIVSRKKQLIPALIQAIQEIN